MTYSNFVDALLGGHSEADLERMQRQAMQAIIDRSAPHEVLIESACQSVAAYQLYKKCDDGDVSRRTDCLAVMFAGLDVLEMLSEQYPQLMSKMEKMRIITERGIRASSPNRKR